MIERCLEAVHFEKQLLVNGVKPRRSSFIILSLKRLVVLELTHYSISFVDALLNQCLGFEDVKQLGHVAIDFLLVFHDVADLKL